MIHKPNRMSVTHWIRKIYDTGMQLKGAHPIVIIMQGDADRLNDREIMIQLTAQLEQANF